MYYGERFNAWSHLIGAVLAVGGVSWLLVMASFTGDPWRITSTAIYGATLILLYLISTLYHCFRGRAKNVFRKMDHFSIYLLIAGSYTPFCLVTLRGPWGWSLFGVVWGLASDRYSSGYPSSFACTHIVASDLRCVWDGLSCWHWGRWHPAWGSHGFLGWRQVEQFIPPELYSSCLTSAFDIGTVSGIYLCWPAAQRIFWPYPVMSSCKGGLAVLATAFLLVST